MHSECAFGSPSGWLSSMDFMQLMTESMNGYTLSMNRDRDSTLRLTPDPRLKLDVAELPLLDGD